MPLNFLGCKQAEDGRGIVKMQGIKHEKFTEAISAKSEVKKEGYSISLMSLQKRIRLLLIWKQVRCVCKAVIRSAAKQRMQRKVREILNLYSGHW